MEHELYLERGGRKGERERERGREERREGEREEKRERDLVIVTCHKRNTFPIKKNKFRADNDNDALAILWLNYKHFPSLIGRPSERLQDQFTM